MSYVEPLLQGAVGGLIGGEAAGAWDQTKDALKNEVSEEPLGRMVTLLEELVRQGTEQSPGEYTQGIYVGAVPQELRYLRRKHILMLVAAATNVAFMIPIVGPYNVTLQPGWNIIDLPEGTTIALQGGQAAFGAVLRLSDESYGNPI